MATGRGANPQCGVAAPSLTRSMGRHPGGGRCHAMGGSLLSVGTNPPTPPTEEGTGQDKASRPRVTSRWPPVWGGATWGEGGKYPKPTNDRRQLDEDRGQIQIGGEGGERTGMLKADSARA